MKAVIYKVSMFLMLGLFLTLHASAIAPKKSKSAKDKPNIIVFLVDDLSYAGLSYTGNKIVSTPHIDALIESGQFCSSGYVTHAVCAPSRAGLLTGRYQARYGYETLSDNDAHQRRIDHGVDTREILLADPLKKAGYKTAAFGKWHLGVNDKYLPNNRGFDYFFGWAGRCDYFKYSNPKQQLLRNLDEVKDIKDGEYFTERMTQEAKGFMTENANNPFFMYFATYNVHKPFKVPDYYIPEGGEAYHGMIAAVDSAVHVLTKTLEDLKLRDNTLIFFLNDNGGKKAYPNLPFREGKATYYEGGVRVPYAVSWPDKIPAGGKYEPMVSSLDIYATCMAVAGLDLPDDREYDGVNLIPYLTGKNKNNPHEILCWRAGWGNAIRKGNWKLVWKRDRAKTKQSFKKQGLPLPAKTDLPVYSDRGGELYEEKPELYDLSKDVSETTNLYDKYPEIVKELISEMDKFDLLPTQKQYGLKK